MMIGWLRNLLKRDKKKWTGMKTIDLTKIYPDLGRSPCWDRIEWYLLDPEVIRSFIPGKAEEIRDRIHKRLIERDE